MAKLHVHVYVHAHMPTQATHGVLPASAPLHELLIIEDEFLVGVGVPGAKVDPVHILQKNQKKTGNYSSDMTLVLLSLQPWRKGEGCEIKAGVGRTVKQAKLVYS